MPSDKFETTLMCYVFLKLHNFFLQNGLAYQRLDTVEVQRFVLVVKSDSARQEPNVML